MESAGIYRDAVEPRASDHASARSRLSGRQPWRNGFDRRLGVFCLLLGAGCCALTIDVSLSAFFRRLAPLVWLNRVETFGHGSGVALIALAIAALEVGGWRRLPRLVGATLAAGLAANLVKVVVARHRPRTLDLSSVTFGDTFIGWFQSLAGGSGWQSFPSGHSASAAALAVSLSLAYPRGKWLFGCLAAGACLQRVAAQAHFASDVLFGAALGWGVAWLVQARFKPRRWELIVGGVSDADCAVDRAA